MQCTHWINPITGTILIIDPEMVEKLIRIGLESSAESGGVIIGQRRSQHFLIQQITLPKIDDIRHRLSIQRSANGHIQEIEMAMNVSEGKLCYLGEWHTHPQKQPIPSETDITTWENIYREIKLPIVCIIVGTEGMVAYETTKGLPTVMLQVLE